jgi:hypothetical protein
MLSNFVYRDLERIFKPFLPSLRGFPSIFYPEPVLLSIVHQLFNQCPILQSLQKLFAIIKQPLQLLSKSTLNPQLFCLFPGGITTGYLKVSKIPVALFPQSTLIFWAL